MTALGILVAPGSAHAATGVLKYDAPLRWPGGTRADWPASAATVTVDGAPVVTSDAGELSWVGTVAASIATTASGPRVMVTNAAGAPATVNLVLDPDGSVTWSASSDEAIDAQISAFIHVERARAYCNAIAPSMTALDQQIEAVVNVDQDCDADSDGTTLFLSHATAGCENAARLADLVYHEFGHVFHKHAVALGQGALDGALGEGVGDYLAATMTGDPAIAPGIHFSSTPLRDIDPAGKEYSWPADIVPDDDAATGLIISGALWDLRKLLVANLGPSTGVATADLLFYGAIRNAVDIPSMFAMVVAEDDDDGSLSNGTPNECAIHEAFAPHGLYSPATEGAHTPLAVPPGEDPIDVILKLFGMPTRCPIDDVASAELTWHLSTSPNTSGTIPVTYNDGSATLTASIPAQPAESVILYQITVVFENGGTTVFPTSTVDPYFTLTVQPSTPMDADGGYSNVEGGTAGMGGAGVGAAPGEQNDASTTTTGSGGGGRSTSSAGSAGVDQSPMNPDGGTAVTPASGSSSGCGCRVPAGAPDMQHAWPGAILALLFLFRRSARREICCKSRPKRRLGDRARERVGRPA